MGVLLTRREDVALPGIAVPDAAETAPDAAETDPKTAGPAFVTPDAAAVTSREDAVRLGELPTFALIAGAPDHPE